MRNGASPYNNGTIDGTEVCKECEDTAVSSFLASQWPTKHNLESLQNELARKITSCPRVRHVHRRFVRRSSSFEDAPESLKVWPKFGTFQKREDLCHGIPFYEQVIDENSSRFALSRMWKSFRREAGRARDSKHNASRGNRAFGCPASPDTRYPRLTAWSPSEAYVAWPDQSIPLGDRNTWKAEVRGKWKNRTYRIQND